MGPHSAAYGVLAEVHSLSSQSFNKIILLSKTHEVNQASHMSAM